MANQKPEGTDAIVEGAGIGSDDGERDVAAFTSGVVGDSLGGDPSKTGGAGSDKPDIGSSSGDAQSFAGHFAALRGQAGDQAREFVTGAKDRVTDGIDDVVKMIEDAADEVDNRLGSQYGDYIRRASDGVADFSSSLKNKDVDALFTEAGDAIRKSPGVAIGVAAAIGFVVARVARAGLDASHSDGKVG